MRQSNGMYVISNIKPAYVCNNEHARRIQRFKPTKNVLHIRHMSYEPDTCLIHSTHQAGQYGSIHASIAQRTERRSSEPGVGSSNLSGGSRGSARSPNTAFWPGISWFPGPGNSRTLSAQPCPAQQSAVPKRGQPGIRKRVEGICQNGGYNKPLSRCISTAPPKTSLRPRKCGGRKRAAWRESHGLEQLPVVLLKPCCSRLQPASGFTEAMGSEFASPRHGQLCRIKSIINKARTRETQISHSRTSREVA